LPPGELFRANQGHGNLGCDEDASGVLTAKQAVSKRARKVATHPFGALMVQCFKRMLHRFAALVVRVNVAQAVATPPELGLI
jgi:hypothetical protein